MLLDVLSVNDTGWLSLIYYVFNTRLKTVILIRLNISVNLEMYWNHTCCL